MWSPNRRFPLSWNVKLDTYSGVWEGRRSSVPDGTATTFATKDDSAAGSQPAAFFVRCMRGSRGAKGEDGTNEQPPSGSGWRLFVMTPAGLEPATYCLGGSRSIHLSYEVEFPIDIIYQVRRRFSSHAGHADGTTNCAGGALQRRLISEFRERTM